ncbi:ABC transporter permease [Microbacter margulisiae]|uniref:ABC-type lipoprotein release transport system permease subunit n=1 Tax=Microbacter margulisiae TaxID=1350067 RepID=A0A7W5DSB3_9PORP|nr:FtsX-like permease family protein [Microbacter margulisiae]MBB3188157.1 ABC-type lipoprotein release transport system permease subunit [Microbacter margulisiae]
MLGVLSWKNVWRNKLRSIVVMIAVMLGVFAGVFLIAFSKGMVDGRIQSIIQTEISHIQIHKPGFQVNNDFSLRMNHIDSIMHVVIDTKHVVAASKRIVISSLVASAETNTGVKIIGIIPSEEKKVTNIHDKIIAGSYFASPERNEVVIGLKLAEKLKVKLHNKIIITLQDVNMNITSGAFRIIGIYQTDNNMFDESTLFVRYSDICRLTGLDGTSAHEIAIILDNNKNTHTVMQQLKAKLPGLNIQDWTQISPEAGYLVSAMNQYLMIFMLVILLALCFGIVNTMLMVVLERVKEIGMLMAVGMSKAKIFFMIMLETVYLSTTGGIAGILIGFILCKHLGKVGLNLYFWKDVYASVGYSSLIYPKIDLQMGIVIAILVIITGILASLYPAYKALKLNPAEATRTD